MTAFVIQSGLAQTFPDECKPYLDALDSFLLPASTASDAVIPSATTVTTATIQSSATSLTPETQSVSLKLITSPPLLSTILPTTQPLPAPPAVAAKESVPMVVAKEPVSIVVEEPMQQPQPPKLTLSQPLVGNSSDNDIVINVSDELPLSKPCLLREKAVGCDEDLAFPVQVQANSATTVGGPTDALKQQYPVDPMESLSDTDSAEGGEEHSATAAAVSATSVGTAETPGASNVSVSEVNAPTQVLQEGATPAAPPVQVKTIYFASVYKTRKVVELKELCKDRKLSTQGSKTDLITRLETYDNSKLN